MFKTVTAKPVNQESEEAGYFSVRITKAIPRFFCYPNKGSYDGKPNADYGGQILIPDTGENKEAIKVILTQYTKAARTVNPKATWKDVKQNPGKVKVRYETIELDGEEQKFLLVSWSATDKYPPILVNPKGKPDKSEDGKEKFAERLSNGMLVTVVITFNAKSTSKPNNIQMWVNLKAVQPACKSNIQLATGGVSADTIASDFEESDFDDDDFDDDDDDDEPSDDDIPFDTDDDDELDLGDDDDLDLDLD